MIFGPYPNQRSQDPINQLCTNHTDDTCSVVSSKDPLFHKRSFFSNTVLTTYYVLDLTWILVSFLQYPFTFQSRVSLITMVIILTIVTSFSWTDLVKSFRNTPCTLIWIRNFLPILKPSLYPSYWGRPSGLYSTVKSTIFFSIQTPKEKVYNYYVQTLIEFQRQVFLNQT